MSHASNPSAPTISSPLNSRSSGALRAFENESQVLNLDSLQIENRLDRISLTGNIDLTKDMQGLKNALALKSVLDGVVETLQKLELPERIHEQPAVMIKNPFA